MRLRHTRGHNPDVDALDNNLEADVPLSRPPLPWRWVSLFLVPVGFALTLIFWRNHLEAVGVWVGAAAVLIAGSSVSSRVKETGKRLTDAIESSVDAEHTDFAHEIAVNFHQAAGRRTFGMQGQEREDSWAEIKLVLYYLREPKPKGVLPGCNGDRINQACSAIVDSAPAKMRDDVEKDLIESGVNFAMRGKHRLMDWAENLMQWTLFSDDVPEQRDRQPYEVFNEQLRLTRADWPTSNEEAWISLSLR